MDKFYTSDSVVDLVLKMFEKHVNVVDDDVIVEPSAGDGSFYKKLSHHHVIALDIEPEHEDVIRQDFLTFVPPRATIHVIGNPPFGKNGSMALKFIKKSHEFADTISFILPKSFKKESVQMKVPRDLELIAQIDLPSNSFLLEKRPYNVPCVFQIWRKSSVSRTYESLKPVGFSFVKKEDKHTCAIRRVGGTAGKIVYDTDRCNVNCFYFIRIDDSSLLTKLKDIDIEEKNYTTGPRSISKRDVIKFMYHS